jgi:hypothetical protein
MMETDSNSLEDLLRRAEELTRELDELNGLIGKLILQQTGFPIREAKVTETEPKGLEDVLRRVEELTQELGELNGRIGKLIFQQMGLRRGGCGEALSRGGSSKLGP